MDDAFLYHTAPLQYVPHILRAGALFAQSVLVSQDIHPRVTATRRDRMLGLADYVHLSFRSDTPLLHDKIQKGYPHVLFQFDRDTVLKLPEIGLVRYNAKAWHSKSSFAPMTDTEDIQRLLRQYARGRYPSLEVVVKYGLSLAHAQQIAFAVESESELVESLLQSLEIVCDVPCLTRPELFPATNHYRPVTLDAISMYFAQCCMEKVLLLPPAIPFD